MAYPRAPLDVGPGHTFILRRPGDGKGHLWVVLTDPDDNGFVLVVSLTTLRDRNNTDTTVILSPGDHDFIKHDTVVSYKDAQPVSVAGLRAAQGETVYRQGADCSPSLLERIQQGARKSRFAPRFVKAAVLPYISPDSEW